MRSSKTSEDVVPQGRRSLMAPNGAATPLSKSAYPPGTEPARRRTSPSWGLVAIVVPYLFGFSVPIYTALLVLTGGDAGLSRWTTLTLVAVGTAVGISVALVLTRTVLKLSWSALGIPGPSGRRPGQGLLLFCAAYFLMWVAMLVFGSVPTLSAPALPVFTTPSPIYVVLYSALTGIGEEILIVAVPIAVMTALRWRWPAQLLVLAVLRTPFHLYYGYTAVLLAVVWSVLYWLLYRRYRWIWPLVAAHALYNCVISRAAFGPTGVVVLRLGAFVVLLLGAGAVVWQIAHERRRVARSGPASSVAPDLVQR